MRGAPELYYMSKIFDELERLEAASQQARVARSGVSPEVVPPEVSAPIGAVPLRQTIVKREEPVLNQRVPEFARPQAPAQAAPAKRHPVQAFAFDASMVLIALAIFVGICVALGGATVLDLTRNAPWLVLVPISLAGLYWLLSKILRRATPGTALARRQSSDSYHEASSNEPSAASSRRGFETFGRLSALPERPQPVNLLKRPLLEELAMASRILGAEGVLDGYGSVSVRDDSNPNRMFLAGAEIAEYDLNGKPANGDPSEGHPERFLHCEIYRTRPDVMAIVHSQAPELIPFAASSVPLLPIIEMADFLMGGVPVFESRRVGPVTDLAIRARAMGQAISETLGDKAAVLMRGRGAVIVGPSLHAAVGRAYYMNMNARLQAQSILLGGTVNYIEPSDAPMPATEFERAWEYWKQKAIV